MAKRIALKDNITVDAVDLSNLARSVSFTSEYGSPLRQSKTPSRSHVGVGMTRPRPNSRCGASALSGAHAFAPTTGHWIASK